MNELPGYDLLGGGAAKEVPLELDGLEMDDILNIFNHPSPHLNAVGNPPYGMRAQVPFRGSSGSTSLLPIASLPSLPNPLSGFAVRGPRAQAQAQAQPDSGGSNGMDEEDPKTLAVQEKNRRAQKRFRERQKAKMKDMTEQLDEMNVELARLRMENNSLKNRNNILEKVLALRDEHIRVLQAEQQVFDLGTHYLQQSALCGSGGQKLLTGATAGSSVSLAAIGSLLVPTDAASIKAMPAEAVINYWKETVRELGNILMEIEGVADASDPRHQNAMFSLCNVLDAAGQLCMHTAVLHPTNMQRLIAATLDDGRSGALAEDRGRWESVTAALALSEDQRTQMTSLRAIFLRRMAKVVEERRGVLTRLQAVSIPDRLVALQSVISETLKVNEATVALKANLQEEHLAGMEFIGTVFKTVFTPLQKARVIVQSYPFYPDMYQIATAVAVQQAGGAQVPELLTLVQAASPLERLPLSDAAAAVGGIADDTPLINAPVPFAN